MVILTAASNKERLFLIVVPVAVARLVAYLHFVIWSFPDMWYAWGRRLCAGTLYALLIGRTKANRRIGAKPCVLG